MLGAVPLCTLDFYNLVLPLFIGRAAAGGALSLDGSFSASASAAAAAGVNPGRGGLVGSPRGSLEPSSFSLVMPPGFGGGPAKPREKHRRSDDDLAGMEAHALLQQQQQQPGSARAQVSGGGGGRLSSGKTSSGRSSGGENLRGARGENLRDTALSGGGGGGFFPEASTGLGTAAAGGGADSGASESGGGGSAGMAPLPLGRQWSAPNNPLDLVDLKLQHDGLHGPLPATQDETFARPVLHACVTLAVLAAAMATAVLVPNVEFIFGLTGATASVLIAYILPALTFIRLLDQQPELAGSLSPHRSAR